jgi:hypothetical protein
MIHLISGCSIRRSRGLRGRRELHAAERLRQSRVQCRRNAGGHHHHRRQEEGPSQTGEHEEKVSIWQITI